MSLRIRLIGPALAALAVLALAAPAAADYEQTGLFAQSGDGQQLADSSGAAVNTTGAGGVEAGSFYVSAPEAVARYSPTGEIKEVWGWGTIASGPDLPNQVNTLTVKATSGTYRLRARTARGRGTFTKESKLVTNVRTEVGAFHVGDVFNSIYFPPGTTITAVNAGTLELSAAVKEGTVSSSTEEVISVSETTAPIPYNASAAELKAALVALPAFEASDLTVTGGPGDAEGLTPYELTFEGAYTGSPVELSSTESTLEGGVPSSAATVATVTAASTSGFQRCRPFVGDRCTPQKGGPSPFHEEGIGNFYSLQGVAVDQSTGYVYVLNDAQTYLHGREHNLIEVFSADGSEVIARFGDVPAEGETIETNPEKVSNPVSIAVDESGRVYLGVSGATGYKLRVMCFDPETPGDYEHYAYCGRSQDVEGIAYPSDLALDDAGHVYIGEEGFIEERSLAEPSAPALCTFNTHGQNHGLAVHPTTGEVFYFNASGSDKSVHRLKPCDPEKGKFEEAQAKVKVSPEAKEIKALALNPTLSWGPNRPPGVLYGADAYQYASFTGIGYILAQAEVRLPEVLSESVSNTRTTSSILHAEIDPHGFATGYVFQYLTQAEYEANEPEERFAGASEAPAGGGEIGSGAVGEASAAVTGLEPDTAYRFRVVATSECDEETGEPCVTDGEAASFATYPLYPPGLPDNRAYELVSPAQKHGGEVVPADSRVNSCDWECKPNTYGTSYPMQSSPDGEALAYEGMPFTPFEGASRWDSYVARRTDAGWRSTALIPALPAEQVSQLAFDRTLSRGLLYSEAGEDNRLEIQDTSEPSSTTSLVSETNHRTTSEFRLSYGGHSADFSRQLFAANDSLTGETPYAPEPPDPGFSNKDLYEWHGGQLTLVNVLPGNATVAEGAKFASINPDTHAVSEDGSTVFFKDEAGSLYARVDGQLTKQISDPGHFLSASPDGTEVLLDDGCLYSLEGEACTDLTEGMGGFEGLVGQSKDLSHIYFVDSEALGGGEANEHGEVAEAGKDNLYSWSGGEARFVAQLTAQLEVEIPGGTGLGGHTAVSDSEDWAANPSARTAEASPDGRFLTFGSVLSLTGYDNVGPCGSVLGEIVDIPCHEAYLFDSATGKLVCASCNPTGEAPLGNTTLRRIAAGSNFPQPRYLTNEGRLYFDTEDSLVARDTNEGVEDVYEYSPQGAGAEGTCEREAGCTRLISAGTEPVDSNLIAVDETGKNVFFDTRDRLALKDTDELLDVYDAREGGGIGAETEVARAECQGEACIAPVYAPNDPTPGSSSFEGAGNVKEPKAKKNKHKKHKKKKRRHKKHARKHGKKHAKQKRHAKRRRARAAKRNHGGAK